MAGNKIIQNKNLTIKKFFHNNYTILTIIIFITFFPCLFNKFVGWDDFVYITNNPLIKCLNTDNIIKIFSSTIFKSYNPLTILFFAIEFNIYKNNLFLMHFSSIILHIINTLLIYKLLSQLKLDKKTVFFSSLLFGIHPIHVETVAWLPGKKDLLYSLFYISAATHYVKYIDTRCRTNYYLSILFSFFSVLSKPMAISLPLILFLIDWIKGNKQNLKTLIIRKIPHMIIIWSIVFITYSQNARIIPIFPSKNILIWLWCYSSYIINFFFPFNLKPLYQLPEPVILSNFTYIFSSLIVIVSIFILASKRNKWLKFAILYYFLSMFFLFRFDKAVDVNIIADRFLYLSCLGLCIIASKPFTLKYDKKYYYPVKVSIIAFLFLICSISFNLCKIWRNEETLWTYANQKNPNNDLILNNLALVDIKRKNFDDALTLLTKANNINPTNIEIINNLGLVYKETKNREKALARFKQAQLINPNDYLSYYNQGLLYFEDTNYIKTIPFLNDALKRNPTNIQTILLLITSYIETNQLKSAWDITNYAIKIYPKESSIALKKLELLLINNDFTYSKQIKKDLLKTCSDTNILANAAFQFAQKNLLIDAIDLYSKAIKLKPNNTSYYIEVAKISVNINLTQNALNLLRNALEIEPNNNIIINLINEITLIQKNK